MIDKIIEKINEKYNIEIKYNIKFTNVYNIEFNIEDKQINIIYIIDPLITLQKNIKELENKINLEIIDFYKRKVSI